MENELKISFGQSPAVARAMAETAQDLYQTKCILTQSGTVLYSAVDVGEPAGKPLSVCGRVQVKLTLWEAGDDALGDMRTRRRVVFQRIVQEAFDQGGVLTLEDCERLLLCDQRTLKRYLAEYRDAGVRLPLRGYVHSTGRGQTHKTEIIHLYLAGVEFSEIQRRTYHSSKAVGRYLAFFSRIVVCHVNQEMTVDEIARVVDVSPGLVTEYLHIYDRYQAHDNERLSLLLHPKELDQLIQPIKKKEATA